MSYAVPIRRERTRGAMLHSYALWVTPRYMQHGSRWLRLLVLAVVLLNLLDAVFTLVWVHTGVATEANALLAAALDYSTIAFMLAKLSVVSAGVLVLWKYRRRRLSVAGLTLVFVIYNALLIYHFSIAAVAIEFA